MVSIPKFTPYQHSGGPPKNNTIFNEILSLKVPALIKISGLELAEIDILYLSNA